MTSDAAFELITKYLVENFDVPPEKIRLEAELAADLELDSIDALDMVGLLEAELDIEVEEEELRRIRTLQDIVDYVLQRVPAARTA